MLQQYTLREDDRMAKKKGITYNHLWLCLERKQFQGAKKTQGAQQFYYQEKL